MLTINLNDEAEKYLIEILAREETNSQELVKKILPNHLVSIQKLATVVR